MTIWTRSRTYSELSSRSSTRAAVFLLVDVLSSSMVWLSPLLSYFEVAMRFRTRRKKRGLAPPDWPSLSFVLEGGDACPERVGT